MAQYSLEEFKRLKICPILSEKKWDYAAPLELYPTYLYGIKEIFRWYYRRGSHISPDVITSSISSHALQQRLDITVRIGLELAFRKYTDSGFYKEMNPPHYNKDISLNLNDKDVLNFVSPCIVKKDKTVYFISYDLGKISTEIFLNRYETIFQSVWSFYVLDTVPVFLNLYYEDKQIKEQRFKVNQEYILKSKEKLIQVGRGLKYSKSIPPPEICSNCNRRTECPEMINVDRLLRK